MRSSTLSARLLQGVLLLFVPPTVVAGGILSLLYFLGVHHHRAALVATLLVGGAAMVVYLAFMVHGMGESLVAALREMQLDTELMATVNPAHRLHIETGDELESLAATINRLGERLSATQASLSSAVAHATEEVTAERALLTGVLDAAGAAIVTLTADRRVGLANSAARALLTTDGRSIVGRTLSDLVHLEDDQHIDKHIREWGAVSLPCRKSDGTTLEAVAATIAPGGGERRGIVLVFREAVHPTGHAAHATPDTAEARALPESGRSVRFVSARPQSIALTGKVSRVPPLYDATLFDSRIGPGNPVDRDRPILELDGVVFDSETTGLDRDGQDRIVSLAGVRVQRGVVRREDIFDVLVNPGRPIPAASTAFHGVTDAVVADAPPIDVILPEFLRFVRGTVLVGHQVWFDLRLLDRESLRLGLPPVADTHAVLDTLLLARLVNGSLGELGLAGLSHRLGVRMEDRHSALGDALATAEIYIRLLTLLSERGIVTLGQTLDAVARLPHAEAY